MMRYRYDWLSLYYHGVTFKLRVKKGILKDEIYKAMKLSDLRKEGVTTAEINHAVKQGWIKEHFITLTGRTVNKVYYWTGITMLQTAPHKRFIEKYISEPMGRAYGFVRELFGKGI